MTAINTRPVLVTGAAGFVGAVLCQRLLRRGDRVIGIDNLNSYYDPALKQARLEAIEAMASAEPGVLSRLPWKTVRSCWRCLLPNGPGWW